MLESVSSIFESKEDAIKWCLEDEEARFKNKNVTQLAKNLRLEDGTKKEQFVKMLTHKLR
jgi:hypothetical protein